MVRRQHSGFGMADNTGRRVVTRSIEAPGGLVCVDIFRRADGSFGFETYRRDPEDGHGWRQAAFHGEARFGDEAAALAAARAAEPWIDGLPGTG